jgi:hypothetical protein
MSAAGTDFPNMAVAFEGQSGEALIVFTQGEQVLYATWSPVGGWSLGSGSYPASINSMELFPASSSDNIMLLLQSDDRELVAAFWGGSIWELITPLTTDTGETRCQPFVFLWTPYVNQPPAVNTATLYESDRTTPVTAMDPQIEYALKVTVSDADTLTDLNTVQVTVFYDSDGDDDPGDVPVSGDTQRAAILTCQVGDTPIWSIDPAANTTWVLVESNCTEPSLAGTSGDFWFHFKPGKVATEAEDWDVYAVADDGHGTPATHYAGHDYDMNWYGEIAINTGDVDWGTVSLGSDFDANAQTGISVTHICNGDYDQRVKSDSPWIGGAFSATLNDTGSPGPGEFSLRANDVNYLGSSILCTTVFKAFDSGSQTGESGNVEAANTLWLKVGATGIPDVTYGGTVYYEISH